MMENDSSFNFGQFSDFCMARSGQRDLSFKTILDDYIDAHPTHAPGFTAHLQQHPELYQQLVAQINTVRPTKKPVDGEDAAKATNWKDRMHSDPEDRGEDRGFERH